MSTTSPHNQASSQEAMTVHVDADFEPLLPKFMTNRKKEVVTMREALAQQDFEAVGKIAHGMKGAGGIYGFERVTAMATTIEQAAKVGNAATIEPQLAQLGTYLEQVHVVFG